MFLITEDDELGLVSAMMHEAAGGLELPDPAEPALSMLGGKKKKKDVLGQISCCFPKVERFFMSKDLCYDFRRESNWILHSHPLDCSSETFIQADRRQNLAAAPADRPNNKCCSTLRTKEVREPRRPVTRASWGSWFCFFLIFWAPYFGLRWVINM